MPEYKQEELRFEVGGQPRVGIVRTPAFLNPYPALFIEFCGAWRDGLDEVPFRMVANIFLAAGHRVASFDMPCHGDRSNEYGGNLAGMVAAIEDGNNIYHDVRDTGVAFINLCLERGLALEGGVVLNGSSRGGLAAMHIMAATPHVLACSIHAPLIYLPAVTEMAGLKGSPVTAACDAYALLDKLADRPLLVVNGETDPRIDEKHVFAFFAMLTARSRRCPPEIYTGPGASHSNEFSFLAGYNAAAAFLLRWCSLWMKRRNPA